jgi:AbrB family looped-hinge helix DNA binding protein
VVIPKPLRDALGIRPGDEVDFALLDGAVRVEPVRDHGVLKGRFRGLRLTEELAKERRRERSRDR